MSTHIVSKPNKLVIPEILKGYLACALWSSTDGDGIPLDSGKYHKARWTRKSLKKARSCVDRFLADTCHILSAAEESGLDFDAEHVGHDLWLTQNRHGAGFWDGDWKQHGTALTEAAHKFPEVYPYIYRGWIYLD